MCIYLTLWPVVEYFVDLAKANSSFSALEKVGKLLKEAIITGG